MFYLKALQLEPGARLSSGVVHKNIRCDGEGCSMFPVRGMRWKCTECLDYDLCTDCFMRRRCHNMDHVFCRIDREDDLSSWYVLVGEQELGAAGVVELPWRDTVRRELDKSCGERREGENKKRKWRENRREKLIVCVCESVCVCVCV